MTGSEKAESMPFTLTITERNHSWAGRAPVTSTHDSHEAADVELLEYVRRNWEAEVGTEPPEDPATMVAEYFADVLEQYDITEDR
jgi:hypothetical protein